MRKVIIGLLIVVVVLGGLLVLAVVNVNALLEENRERIAQLASEATGRQVAFDKAQVAFPGRLSVEISGLRISEDPGFGEGDFLSLDTAYVAVEILPALQKRLEVTGVRFDRPKIRVVQTSSGFNFSTIGAVDAGGAETEPSEPVPDPAPSGNGGSPPMALAIAGFRILDGTILVEDRTSDPPLALTIENFESSGTELFGDDPIDITFTGLARPTAGNAKLASPFVGNVRVKDLEAGVADLRLESAKFHPLLLGLEFGDGEVIERLESLVLDVSVPANVDRVGYPISLRSAQGHIAGIDYEDLGTSIVYRGSDVDIQHFDLGVAGGKVGLKGTVALGEPTRSPFNIETKLEALDTGELAAILLDLPRGYLTGKVGGEIDLAGNSLEWATLQKTLSGKVRLDFADGALERVNVVERLVAGLQADPGLGQLAADSIRDVAPESLEGNRTEFQSVRLALNILNGVYQADTVEFTADDFAIGAAGALGFDGSVTGDGQFRFSEELSAKIRKKADRLAPLFGDGQSVEVPIIFGGTTDSLRIAPDVVALTAMARENANAEVRRDAAEQLTDAIFGKKKERAEGEEPTQEDQDREATADLINQGLGRLFGD